MPYFLSDTELDTADLDMADPELPTKIAAKNIVCKSREGQDMRLLNILHKNKFLPYCFTECLRCGELVKTQGIFETRKKGLMKFVAIEFNPEHQCQGAQSE